MRTDELLHAAIENFGNLGLEAHIGRGRAGFPTNLFGFRGINTTFKVISVHAAPQAIGRLPLKYPHQRGLSQRVSRTAQPNQSQTRLIALQAVSELKPCNEQRKEAAQSPVKYRSLPSQINDTFPTSQPCRRQPVEKSRSPVENP